MRRGAALILLLGACAAPPPAAAPAATIEQAPEPPRPARLGLEGTAERKNDWRVRLVARDAAGKELWSTEVPRGAGHALGADGSAYYGVGGRKDRLVKRDPRGQEVWSVELAQYGLCGRVLVDGEVVLLLGRDLAHLARTSDGSAVATWKNDAGVADPAGGFALVSGDVITRISPKGEVAGTVRVGRFPGGDPAVPRHQGFYGQRSIAFLPDGVLVTGGGDGALLGLDHDNRPRFQLGVRETVTSLVPLPGGELVVTSGGTLTRLGAGGRVRWEARVSAERLAAPVVLADGTLLVAGDDGALHAVSADGALLWHEPLSRGPIDKPVVKDGQPRLEGPNREQPISLTAPHPAEPVVEPTGAYRAQRVLLDGAIVGEVQSIVALAPDDVWILAGRPRHEPRAANPRLLRWDGRALAVVPPPKIALRRERFDAAAPPAVGELGLRALARGPGGALVVVATRDDWSKSAENLTDAPAARALVLLERDGSGFRERRDLFATFAKMPSGWGSTHGDLRLTTGPRGQLVLCAGGTCAHVGDGAPRLEDVSNGGPLTPAFLGDTLWYGTAERILRGAAIAHEKTPTADLPPVVALAGSGPEDLWALAHDTSYPSVLIRFDGRTWVDSRAPLPKLDTLLAQGPGDVWAQGPSGVLHLAGQQWTRLPAIAGQRYSSEADAWPLALAGRDDVWVGRPDGLWHVTRDPGAGPDLPGSPAPVPEASAGRSPAVAAAPSDGRYRLTRVTIPVAGEEPLRWALGVAAAPDGTAWLWDDHRVIELDGSTARRLFRAPPHQPLSAHHAVAPAGRGEGFFLAAGLHRVSAGRASREAPPFPDPSALGQGPSGLLWAVTDDDDDDGAPRALVRAGGSTRLVRGLLPAAYAGVAVRAADDVWLAGGLMATASATHRWPAGEGLLVHFDGRAFTRRRAPDGALLAVAAAGPSEAWAVGVGGSLIHARAEGTEAVHVEPAVLLRGVAAAAGQVFAVGDEGTVLHHDGQALRRVDAPEAGRDGAFTCVVAPGTQAGWVVGPAGIYRLSAGQP